MAHEASTPRGVIPTLVTPYSDYGGIDTAGVGRLVEHVIAGGVHGVAVNGDAGEFVNLSRGEKLMVIEAAVEAAAGRVPVYAGTGAESTEETLALTWDAAKAGANAAIVVTPYYFGLPQDALVDHYAEIARRGRLPIIVANIPCYSGNNLTPDTLARLAEIDSVIGLEQSNADLGQLVETLRLAGDRFAILTGIDSQCYPALCAGTTGIFSTTACVMPREVVAIYDAFRAGDHERARELHRRAQALNRLLEASPGHSATCKAALALLGLPGGPVRRPLPDLAPEARDGVRAALLELQLL